jgi:ABC-type Fe3+ transport system permease subunit
VSPHFTLSSLAYAYGEYEHFISLRNSIAFAGLTATLVLILGGGLAWAAARTDSMVRHFVDLFALAPILIPSVVFVSGWILLLGPKNGFLNLLLVQYFGVQNPPFNVYSFWGMIWVATLQELPLAFLWLWPAFRAMNPDLEEAALMVGASPGMIMRRISLPLLRPALLSAWIIFFIYSIGALMVPLMIGLPSRIILYSTEIYLAAHRVPSDLNLASAYSLLVLITSFLGIYAYRRSVHDTARRHGAGKASMRTPLDAGAPRLRHSQFSFSCWRPDCPSSCWYGMPSCRSRRRHRRAASSLRRWRISVPPWPTGQPCARSSTACGLDLHPVSSQPCSACSLRGALSACGGRAGRSPRSISLRRCRSRCRE